MLGTFFIALETNKNFFSAKSKKRKETSRTVYEEKFQEASTYENFIKKFGGSTWTEFKTVKQINGV